MIGFPRLLERVDVLAQRHIGQEVSRHSRLALTLLSRLLILREQILGHPGKRHSIFLSPILRSRIQSDAALWSRPLDHKRSVVVAHWIAPESLRRRSRSF